MRALAEAVCRKAHRRVEPLPYSAYRPTRRAWRGHGCRPLIGTHHRTSVTDSREADAMRRLTFGMNLSLDGYIAAPGDDLGWSVPSDELFQWWSDRVGATGLALYGR